MKRAVPLSLVLVLAGLIACGPELRRVPVAVDPLVAPGETVRLVVSGAAGDAALVATLVAPALAETGIAVASDGQRRLVVAIEHWGLDEDKVRLVRDAMPRDGGAARKEREVALARVARCRLRVTLNQRSWPVEAVVYSEPVSDHRHPAGSWQRDGREVTLAGGGGEEALRQAAARAAGSALGVLLSRGGSLGELVFEAGPPALEPGLAFAVDGRLDAAAAAFHEAALADPGSAAAAFDLAVVLEALGEGDHAAEWYAQALARDPQDRYRQALEACRRRHGLGMATASATAALAGDWL